MRHATGRSGAGGRPAEGPRPGRWRALTVSLIAAFMALLDVSIVNLALPSIERDLGATATSVQWVVSGHALALGLALVPAGRLSPWTCRSTSAVAASPATVVASPDTVSQRPTRATSRPATTAETATPTATGVTARPERSGE